MSGFYWIAGPGADNIPVPMVAKIENLILTHSHLDHTSMLCFLADARINNGNGINIHCLKETADVIRRGLLNNDIWPDMESVQVDGRPLINFNYIKECYVEMKIDGCRITPFRSFTKYRHWDIACTAIAGIYLHDRFLGCG